MGVVYRARQVGLNRLVALKMILHRGYASEEERRRFQAEAEAVARLQHPNIVQIYEVGEHQGHPYYSLELCPGGSLAARLDGTPWQPREAVLLAEDGTPKISDFGLAKRLGEAGQTASGAVLGTPSYMAPEQAGASPGRSGRRPTCTRWARSCTSC
jgi:serine/threonine-protein kinase